VLNRLLENITALKDIFKSWFEEILNFGSGVDSLLNAIVGAIIITFIFLITLHKIQKRLKVNRVTFTEKIINSIIELIPSLVIKSTLSKMFDIEFETFILVPMASNRNYQHLAYQLNGVNRFLEDNIEYRDRIKILLIDNSTRDSTNDTIERFVHSLSKNKRYVIIATMSDIFDTLLMQIGKHKFKDRSYRKMVKIIGALASQSEKYVNYERYDNIIRLSPPDFDEAKKASFNIVSKLISSFCPSKSCEYHKNNNIIIISSNSYGNAVKKSFLNLFAEHKKEFDTNTNIDVDVKDLERGIFKFTYNYDIHTGILEDAETNYSFDVLLEEKIEGAINTIFIIGYEPNISNILKEIDRLLSEKVIDNGQFTILISATVSVKEWKNSVIETIKNLPIRDKISEVNFIKIKYPKFFAYKDSYPLEPKKIYFKLYTITEDEKLENIDELSFKREEMKNIIYKRDMNYINGFMYMSLEFVKQLNIDWNTNLLSLKERLFHNKDINDNDILGVKILSTGDSINHFKIQKLKLE